MSDLESGPNAEQARSWSETNGPKWVALQERIDAQISPLGLAAIERAGPRAGQACLDVGCGCGQTTLQLAERVAPGGRVSGLDLSAPMLEHATTRARQAGVALATFERGDAQIHPFEPASLDLVFSRFGVMFFENPVAAFANLRRALKPTGKLVFVCWGPPARNAWVTVPLSAAAKHLTLTPPPDPFAPGPFSFADSNRIRSVLGDAGYEAVEVEPLEREIEVGGGATPAEVIDFVLQIGPTARALTDADAGTVDEVRKAVREALEPHFADGSLRLGATCWIVSAKPTGG